MFLATTALSDFWDKDSELLFLGPWCRLHERRREWEGLRGSLLENPWEAPGAFLQASGDVSALHEALLAFLVEFLNKAHGVRRGERYWRIVAGPWLLGFTSVVVDHALHLDRAFALHPGLTTWTLDPADRRTPLDTAHFAALVGTDLFQLQIYSELLEARGGSFISRRATAVDAPPAAALGPKAAVRSLLARAARAALGTDRVFSDFYAGPRQTLALMRAAGLTPMGEAVASPNVPPDPARRAPLAGFRSEARYASLAAALLPRHLPILFLEGHKAFRDELLARWPRLPRLLLTSVGWYSNEPFKLLAAEAVEQGATLIGSQHGGGYGQQDAIFSEAHERRTADRYLTWGWTDEKYPGAKLTPLPSPTLDCAPHKPGPRTGRWLLVSTTLYRYPYSCYFANAPAAHRFPEQIADRATFLRGLGDTARAGARVRLHHADLGWGHRARLLEEFPSLAFDTDKKPWTERAGDWDLVVADHPQTSLLECLARDVPSLFFWNPALWRMRPEAGPALDGLRKAGILFDSPEAAARELPTALADPRTWWANPEKRAARAAFCDRHARSSPDWLAQWTKVLG